MNDWFKELNTLLTVAVSYELDGSSQDDAQPATIRFMVTNSAVPAQPGHSTEIRFDRVSVSVGLPSELQSIHVGVLRPGDSTTVEYKCHVSELPDIQYDLSGDISPEAIFHVTPTAGTRLPREPANLPPGTYLRMFKEMDVHRWQNSTVREFPLPGADTTLAQLSELTTALNDPIPQILSAQERLSRILQFISRRNLQDRDALNRHRTAVETYLSETIQRIAEVQRSLASSDVRQIGGAVQQAIDRLEREATRLDQATDELTARIASS